MVTLSEQASLACLVLGHLVGCVFSAFLGRAESVLCLGYVDLQKNEGKTKASRFRSKTTHHLGKGMYDAREVGRRLKF